MGFEPTRGDPIGLAGRRLNHSAKVSLNFLKSCRLATGLSWYSSNSIQRANSRWAKSRFAIAHVFDSPPMRHTLGPLLKLFPYLARRCASMSLFILRLRSAVPGPVRTGHCAKSASLPRFSGLYRWNWGVWTGGVGHEAHG